MVLNTNLVSLQLANMLRQILVALICPQKSYDQLISNTEFWDFITFITVIPLWNYTAAVSNLVLYCITTYSVRSN